MEIGNELYNVFQLFNSKLTSGQQYDQHNINELVFKQIQLLAEMMYKNVCYNLEEDSIVSQTIIDGVNKSRTIPRIFGVHDLESLSMLNICRL